MDANVVAEQLNKITGKPGQAGVILHGNGGHIGLGDGKHPIISVTIRPDGLIEAVVGAAALVIRSETVVTAAVLEAGRSLVALGRAGIGLDNVDIEAATRRGVMVINAPESNILSAAEHAVDRVRARFGDDAVVRGLAFEGPEEG